MSIVYTRMCVHLRKKAGAFETSRVYSVVYIFLRRWKKSFYLLGICNEYESLLTFVSPHLQLLKSYLSCSDYEKNYFSFLQYKIKVSIREI
jgi:hypothetical protein